MRLPFLCFEVQCTRLSFTMHSFPAYRIPCVYDSARRTLASNFSFARLYFTRHSPLIYHALASDLPFARLYFIIRSRLIYHALAYKLICHTGRPGFTMHSLLICNALACSL